MRCVDSRARWSSWSDEKPSQPRARLYNQESLGSCCWWSSDNPGTSLYGVFLCSLDVLVYSCRMLYSIWATNYMYMIIPRWWTAQCFPQCKRDFKAGEREKGEKETSEGHRVEVTTGEKDTSRAVSVVVWWGKDWTHSFWSRLLALCVSALVESLLWV